jgi:hypothetical protein
LRLTAWVPWVITCLVFGGQWLIGNKNRQGFLIILVSNTVMNLYNVATEQYGFIPVNLFAALLAFRNFWKWGPVRGEKCDCGEGGGVARR